VPQNCSCGSICPNRVAQKPRDVPLQIFKTKHRGWGVRTPKALPKGKVIGIFTGSVVPTATLDTSLTRRRWQKAHVGPSPCGQIEAR
jgi:histone-lysine N-methyltransferase SUV39H